MKKHRITTIIILLPILFIGIGGLLLSGIFSNEADLFCKLFLLFLLAGLYRYSKLLTIQINLAKEENTNNNNITS